MKTRIYILLYIGLLLNLASCKDKDPINQFWVNKNIAWKSFNSGNPQMDSILEASNVNVLVFHPNGQFRLLSGDGGLGNDSISLYVEIYKIISGTWNNKDKHQVELSYKVSCSFLKQKEVEESPTVFKTILLDLKDNEFKFEDHKYIPTRNLSLETRKRLSRFANLPISNLRNSCY